MISFILNIPYTIIGLMIALISIPKLKVDLNAKPLAIIIHARSFWWALGYIKNARAMTIGHTVILGPNLEKNDLEHELVHVEQYSHAPIIFPILYYTELFRKGNRNNKYELEAYLKSDSIYKER